MSLYECYSRVCFLLVSTLIAALATVTRITSIRAGQNADNNKSVSMQLMITSRMRDVLINELKCVVVALLVGSNVCVSPDIDLSQVFARGSRRHGPEGRGNRHREGPLAASQRHAKGVEKVRTPVLLRVVDSRGRN
jgi:hypothetical protein